LPKARRSDPDAVTQAIERSVRGAVNAVWGKRPVCHVLVVQI
jgi:ribonuclease J